MSESIRAQFDPGTGMIALILDQADAQSLVDALPLTGPPRVRQALQGALQDAAINALAAAVDTLMLTGPPHVRQALQGALQDAAISALAATDQSNTEQPNTESSDQRSKPLVVATDGGSSPNPGPSGWAWVDEHRSYGAGSIPHGTNNIAELTALEQALLAHPARSLHIVYDSKYAVMSVTEWGPSWKSSGKTGKANQKQIFRIMALLEKREKANLITEFEWVKGHSGHPLNELADQVATRMRLRGDDYVERGDVP